MDTGLRERKISEATIVGGVVNFVLLVLKFIAGVLGGSAAMIADAVHSLTDFVTDIIVLVFVKLSARERDSDHEYGHGKYETLATALVGLALLFVGIGIFWKGVSSIWAVLHGEALAVPGKLALWAALASIVVKELLYQYTVRVGRKYKSPALVSNAWHHRSDAFSSVGTAVGIGGAILLGENWAILDPIAAVVVSVLITKASIEMLLPCVQELLETSVKEAEVEIERIVAQIPKIQDLHNLRTRKSGNLLVVDMHIRMDPLTPLCEAHDAASEIEARIREIYGSQTIINIHLEPIK